MPKKVAAQKKITFTKGKNLTKSGIYESYLFYAAQRLSYVILPPVVKRVNVEFFEELDIKWSNGFGWLWDKETKTVNLVVSPEYYGKNVWLVAHELAHAAQIITGEIIPLGKYSLLYKNNTLWYMDFEQNKDRTSYWSNGSQRRQYFSTPWEKSANTVALKALKKLGLTHNVSLRSARNKLKKVV